MAEGKYQRVKVVRRQDHASDLWTLRLQPEAPLPFKPGQYATLVVGENSRLIERPYSIVSSPMEDELEFFFEAVPRGELTPWLHRLQAGDGLLMRRQAKGLFTLDTSSGHKRHFLVCTVTGVAPYVSMVRTLMREAEQGRVPGLEIIVLHAASRSWEFAYRQELEAAAARYSSWLKYIPTVSRPWEDADWKGEVGRVEDVLRKHLDLHGFKPSSATAYLCGHPAMIQNSREILKRRGFGKESIKQEVYWVPKKEEK
jgi:ferredoxin/flavodoxin---NADP+ reductase